MIPQIGQRWKFDVDFIAETVGFDETEYRTRKYVKYKIIQKFTDSYGEIGKVSSSGRLYQNEDSTDKLWKYLEGQDKPIS